MTKLEKTLKKYAKHDIDEVFRRGAVAVLDTKLGNIHITLNSDGKTVHVASTFGTTYRESLTKKEAVEFLASNFTVVED